MKISLPSLKLSFLSLGMAITSVFAPLARADVLTIAAAASLQDALAQMKSDLEKALPGTTLRITTGASGTLQQQISQGAPIDIFLSAADRPVEELEKLKLLTPGSKRKFLGGELVLISPKSSSMDSFKDLSAAGVKRIAIGEPRSVPAGEYAVQTLNALKLDRVLSPKFLYAKDVRQVLSYVARGEVEAGFVYRSDLHSEAGKSVKIVEAISESSHKPIRYTMALVAASKNQESGQKLLNFFESPKAAAIWAEFGFNPLTEKSASLQKEKSSAPK
jgi:molybdate transport system substrate-binding protein